MAHLVRRRTLAAAVALASVAAGLAAVPPPASADTSPGPPVAGISCQPEQFPAAGAPRNSPSVPYEIPFTATLGPDPEPAGVSSNPPVYPAAPSGGWLEIDGTSRMLPGFQTLVILGGPVVAGKGQIYARSCGRLQLPSQVGGIGADTYPPTGQGGQVNPNFVFSPEIPVCVGVAPVGIHLPSCSTTGIVAYGSADGFLASDVQRQPAANGGLNVDFYSTAKSTTNLSALLSLLGTSASGQDCTVTIGDLATAGLPVPPSGVDGLDHQQATTPVHLSTVGSVPDPVTGLADSGQPVTGPIAPNSGGHAQDSAVLVANDFPVAAIDTNMPPSPGYPGPATCSASNAATLNNLIGLPNPAGRNFFYAPGTFGVFTSS
jgi:hypothetical protein